MNKKMQQTLWVTSVSPREFSGQTYIPTAIKYIAEEKSVIGTAAINSDGVDNQNFKIDLGEVVPGGSTHNRKKFKTNFREKSAYELTKDYFDNLLGELEKDYPRSEATNHKHPAKIIVAEPLAFQIEGHSKQWITNYRANIRRILDRYEQVEFLPEPFAVYQYYRYGLRLPGLQKSAKQVALILDFGGGTFDTCIIESTNSGDISQAGKSSKPLSANSIPIGGFYINRRIAIYLIKRHLDGREKSEADKYILQYERVIKGELEISVLKDRAQNFIKNLEKLEGYAERYKLDLVSRLTDSDWGLEDSKYRKILVSVPKNPFSDSEWFDVEFFSHNLREIFIKDVWDKYLKEIVKDVLGRVEDSLGDKRITMTLISGGSSNFRWMLGLLERDFGEDLYGAEPVPIEKSYQEVVANGLAIECARRYFSDDSEFVAVTYNPIKLFLRPDNSDLEKDLRYQSLGDRIDMSQACPGDLIPSAQSIRHFFDEEIKWKFKLKKPPKHHLEYYFVRPEVEGGAKESDSYNVEETSLVTRDSKHFDNRISVCLTVKGDGTALPKFIYKTPNIEHGVEENSVEGRQFYIDMTSDAEAGSLPQNFIGFDFGTSSSSVCLLTQDHIKLRRGRERSPNWNGLSASLSKLPYPVAISVRKFLSEYDRSKIADSAREAFESALAFMAYVASSEASGAGFPVPVKNNFQHRSMGPLKDLLARSVNALKDKVYFSVHFKEMIEKGGDYLNEAISDFNDHKHHKLSDDSVDWEAYVEYLIRVIAKTMESFNFGYCVTSEPEGFEEEYFVGKFTVAHDNCPFVTSFDYRSEKSINPKTALLHDDTIGTALSLTPWIFWGSDRGKCYWLDKFEDNCVIVKLCSDLISDKAEDIDNRIDNAAKHMYETGSTVVGRIKLARTPDTAIE